MPAHATGHHHRQHPIGRSNHPSHTVTTRDLRDCPPTDRHHAHPPHPVPDQLDKYLLRWFSALCAENATNKPAQHPVATRRASWDCRDRTPAAAAAFRHHSAETSLPILGKRGG